MKQFYKFYALADEKLQRSVAVSPLKKELKVHSSKKEKLTC